MAEREAGVEADRAHGPGGPGTGAQPGSDGPGNDEIAELVWRIGEDVEPAVRYVIDGREYVAGAGPPGRTVEMTEAELRAEATAIDEDRDETD